MTRRRVLTATAVLSLIVTLPFVVYATVWGSSRLDRFISLRELTFSALHKNAAFLPPGIQPRMPQDKEINLKAVRTELDMQSDHIRAVVDSGKEWFGDTWSSHELILSDDIVMMPAGDIAMMLSDHFTIGIESIGFRSSQSGGPTAMFGAREMHTQLWRARGNELIITLSVVVDRGSKSAHVSRFVHERFE